MKNNIKNWSTDRLIETLYWIRDRRNYCRACNIRAPLDDIQIENDIYAELDNRNMGVLKL